MHYFEKLCHLRAPAKPFVAQSAGSGKVLFPPYFLHFALISRTWHPHWPNKNPVPMTVIAKNQRVSLKFLNQILLNLKQLGYVTSVRGKEGGYILVKAPRDINLFDVIQRFEKGTLGANTFDGPDASTKALLTAWKDADTKIMKILSEINFEQIKTRAQALEKVNVFSI